MPKQIQPHASLLITGKLGDRVLQRVKPGLGNVPGDPTRSLQNRRYVAHKPGSTPAQAAQRAKFTAGIAAWRLLTDSEKSALRKVASKRAITAYNLFMSAWMRTV